VNDFQVGTNRFVINRAAPNLVTVSGNVVSTNVTTSNILRTTNNKFVVNSVGSNVLKITGNTYSTNLAVGNQLVVGENNDGSSNAAFSKMEMS
jgi:subtilase family serine protease